MNFNIRVIMFDMGGVLLRTVDPQPRVRLANKYNITREELEKLVFASEISLKAEAGTANPEDVWGYVQKKLRIAVDDLDSFKDEFWAGDRLDDELLALISSLRGNYRTVLLSNAWIDTQKNVAQRFGTLDAFEMLVFSAEVGLRKPDPKIFQHVLDLLGADPEEVVFVDDFAENIQAARRLGMRAIQFKNTRQVRVDLAAMLELDSA